MISDGKARRIAAEWHAPGTAMSAFSHLGMIEERLLSEIDREVSHLEQQTVDLQQPDGYARSARRELIALRQYVEHHAVNGVRDRQEGWSKYWDSQHVVPNDDGTYR